MKVKYSRWDSLTPRRKDHTCIVRKGGLNAARIGWPAIVWILLSLTFMGLFVLARFDDMGLLSSPRCTICNTMPGGFFPAWTRTWGEAARNEFGEPVAFDGA